MSMHSVVSCTVWTIWNMQNAGTNSGFAKKKRLDQEKRRHFKALIFGPSFSSPVFFAVAVYLRPLEHRTCAVLRKRIN